jgi:hypothetical protein
MDLDDSVQRDSIESYDDPEQLVKFIEQLTLSPKINSPQDAMDIVVRNTKPAYGQKQPRLLVKFATKVT